MEESPPRKLISTVDGGTKSRDDASENREKRSFLGAIMGGFSAPPNATKGTIKRKLAQLMVVHAAAAGQNC